MKFIRYQSPSSSVEYAALSANGEASVLEGDPFGGFTGTDRKANVAKLLAPITPTSIFCIGLNYRKHAEETRSPIPHIPVVFMKGINTVQHPDQPVLLPRWMASAQVDYEVELAIVIGKACKNVTRENALEYVLGYTCANDVSARDWQKGGGSSQWCRGKTFDTFAPLGPCIVTSDEIRNPNNLGIKTTVNGETMQNSSTADMIFDVPTLIEFLSGSTTLLPGTVIFTGTPEGVGMGRTPPRFLQPGDTVSVEIEGIGKLTNPVQEEAVAPGSTFRL